jgi:Pyruvate/2-oxoglutarate dehydrogenase complex, dehydrogenase (E1) component, eukaryotic type, beta subunit
MSSSPDQAESMLYGDALRHAMRDAMLCRPDTIILGQGVDDHKGTFGTTLGLAEEFGADRVFDTPLAEEGMTGIAIGAALNGLYPIMTHIRADFALLATNQIINLAAKYRYMFGGRYEVPLLIRMVVGRSWGQGAQHSQSLQSLFAHIPGLVVVMPSSPRAILDTYAHAVRNVRNPVLSFEHRLMYGLSFRMDTDEMPTNPMTSRRVRPGRHLTIVATSIMVLEALRAAQHLAQFGIEAEVIDLHCVSHPDPDLLMDSVRRTGHLLIADTSWLPYGVAAEVCRLVVERDPSALKAPVVTLGMAPASCPTAKALEDLFYPNLRILVDRAASLVYHQTDHGIPLPQETSMSDVYKRFKGPF